MKNPQSFKGMILASIVMLAVLSFGCKKEIEAVADCLGQTASLNFDHTISTTDSKQATLTVMYSGDFVLQNSVNWSFGDGNSQNTSTTSTTHAYASPGTYEATAKVTIKKGSESCTFDLKETITIK